MYGVPPCQCAVRFGGVVERESSLKREIIVETISEVESGDWDRYTRSIFPLR